MKSLYIRNFKNLSSLDIDKLDRVNLIVGKNDVGKSTLLEAISIYLANGATAWIRTILDARGEVIGKQTEDINVVKKHFLSLFTGRKEDYNVANAIRIGESAKDEALLTIQQVKLSVQKLENVNLFESDEKEANDFEDEIVCLRKFVGKRTSLVFYKSFPIASMDTLPFQYVHTVDFNTKDNAKLYDNIAMTDKESFLIQALNVINPNIRKINFISDNEFGQRVPIVVLEGDDTRYRLSSMGDGVNRLLTIVLAMLNCKNGTLLVDEFDTGLHYSVQDKLWDIVFLLSEKLNVQVFATTHSNDCIRSFAKANENKPNGQCIRLDERGKNIVPTVYESSDDILFALKNNIEIR